MIKANLRTCASAAALGMALASFGTAHAQTAQPSTADQASADDSGDSLNTIVVTASAGNRSQIESSVSVTNVSADVINKFQPSSESEVFRLLPGIQVSGTAGPGGNSNIAVRGLPVATGGSPFVQIQEDGLPTVLFGDIQFGNNDYWTHYDATVASVEAVRGGSASTFASQAPGAVINYISNTGEKEGGYIELQKGINYDQTRANFRYGGPINDTLRFHVGGYVNIGHGPLHADYNVSDSFQIKGNVTKDFGGGAGYLQLNFKVADTQEPNYTGSPALATINGLKVSNIKPFPGFDGRDQSNYSTYNRDMLIYNRDQQLERVPLDGITTKALAFGSKFHYEFGDTIRVDNNMRWTSMSGGFAAPFFNVGTTASVLGSTVNGSVVDSIRYASGPNAGQDFTGQYVDNNVNVRTNIRDIGSFVNDFALTGDYDVGIGTVTARAGYFYMDQTIAMDWHVNKSLREVNGNNPSQLDLYDAAGNQLTLAGTSGYNNNWGACCARDYDLSYTDQAPFLSLNLDADSFALDGSIRFDRVKASGSGRAAGAEFLIDADGAPGGLQLPALTANGPAEVLNYSRSYTSYSLGALYKATQDLSLFVRASRGGRFNGDRQTFGGKISNSGALCTSAQATALSDGCSADGVTPSVDVVNQYELGVKNRGDLGGGRYSVELTLLKGDFKQSTFELSATRCPGGAGGCVIDARYKSTGAELYATYQNGGFSLVGNATYSKAKKSGVDGTGTPTPFARSPNLPDLSYTVSANYDADMFSVGLATTGQSSATDDAGRVYPGKAVFNGNLRFRPVENLELGLQAYNLFNTFDLRGNGNVADGSASPVVISGAPALGRTFTASARFNF